MKAKVWSFLPAVAVVANSLNSAKYRYIQFGLTIQIDWEPVKLQVKYKLKGSYLYFDRNVENKREYYYCPSFS